MSQERELDTYLQGKTDLSRLYADAQQIEPPDHLDAAILAEAHRAVNARPGARPKRRWAIPLGLVASLFAVVMIGLQLPYLLKEAAPLQVPAETGAAAAMDRAGAEQAPVARLSESGKSRGMDKAGAGIDGNKPAPQAAEAYARPAAPEVAAPMAAMPAPAMAAKRAEMSAHEDAANTKVLSQEKKSADVGESSNNDARNQRAPASAGMAPPERELMKDGAGKADLRPEDWLARIRALRQEGKLEEARKELREFRKRYPGYPVPTALEAG